MNKEDILKQYTYYFIIAVISILSLAFLPMLGSDVGLEWAYPTTLAGKIVWWTTKCLVAFLNVLIFYSFRKQAIVNISTDVNYIKANEILARIKNKEVLPRSPYKYNARIWSTKGVTIAVGSAAGTIALTQALLAYDWVTMLTYLFTIIMGLVFGILQMKNDETYWTTEYLQYAILKENESNGNN